LSAGRHACRRTLAGVPQLTTRYTPEQEAALKRLAQLIATWIKRDVDAKLAASRRLK